VDLQVPLLYTNNTKNELRRLIQQGAVKVDGQKVSSPQAVLKVPGTYLIQVARRSFVKVCLVKA
jgi:tyrosyl-tRNA synthetase